MSQIRAFCLVFLAIPHLGSRICPFFEHYMPIEFVCLQIIDACSEHCMSNAIEFTARAAAVMPNFGPFSFVLLKHLMHRFNYDNSPLLDQNCCQICRFLPPFRKQFLYYC